MKTGDGVDESATYYSYDITGNARTVWQYQAAMEQALAGQGLKRMDYDFDLVSGKVNSLYYQKDKGDQFIYRYLYDADNRLISTYTSRDNLTWHNDATYQYYLHGPRARTELGTHKVQGMDYAYTLQGWLKGINGSALNAETDMGRDGDASTVHSTVARDAMTYVLGYHSNDYAPIGAATATAFNGAYSTPAALSTGNGLYNGNISYTTVSLSKLNGGTTAGYSYGYDQLNRLQEMRRHDITVVSHGITVLSSMTTKKASATTLTEIFSRT